MGQGLWEASAHTQQTLTQVPPPPRVIFFPCRSPIPCVFFFARPRASPAYIKGNENECYAGSQIYESKSCILLINKALLPSDVRNHAMLPAWRLLAGKCYYCFLSCPQSNHNEWSNQYKCVLPQKNPSDTTITDVGLTAEYPATSKLYY